MKLKIIYGQFYFLRNAEVRGLWYYIVVEVLNRQFMFFNSIVNFGR